MWDVYNFEVLITMKTSTKNFANIANKVIEVKKLTELNLQQQRFWVYAVQIMQRKIASCAASRIPIDWGFVRRGEVSFKEFSELFSIGDGNHTAFKASIKSMTTFSLMVKYLNKDEDYFPVFSKWRFSPNTNKISWEFNNVFDEIFLDLSKGYFTIAIEEIATFDSAHAVTLYMLLKSKLNMDAKEHKFELKNLKQLLNVEKKYALFKDFRVRVLDVAKKYIDHSPACPFTFNYKTIKEGKKVVEIEFILFDKRNEGNYYESRNLLPNYKKNQDYKNIITLTNHDVSTIAEIAKLFKMHIDEHGYDPEQTLFKMYKRQLSIELEDYNTNINQQQLDL